MCQYLEKSRERETTGISVWARGSDLDGHDADTPFLCEEMLDLIHSP